MYRRRRLVFVVAAIALIGAAAGFVVATRGPPAPSADPPGTFSFAVLGDAPYYPWEDIRYPLVLRDMDAHDLTWVLHVGDILWRPCSDELFRMRLGWFNGLRHPVIYTPGDNEWTDCWMARTGGFVPLERLDRIREIFFREPTRSLGKRRLPLVSQGGRGSFPELVENARWSHHGVVFATVHLVGSMNGLEKPRPRTAADDTERKRRTEGAAVWVRETFNEARAVSASAVVIGFHANAVLEWPAGDPYREAYEPFIIALEEEVERFGKPVLGVHGDHHEYTIDHPLVRRTTGRRLDHFTRLQVPGSPRVGWVRVVVTPGAEVPWAFEERVVPRWKYW